MKIVAKLIFWDESPARLRRWAKSIGQLADCIVAVDGPFAAYPHRKVESDRACYAALQRAAEESDTELHIIHGREWAGQVEKRDRALGYCRAVEADWIIWSDADELIVECDVPAIRAELAATSPEVHGYRAKRFTPKNENGSWKADSTTAGHEEDITLLHPRILRCLDEMRVVERHWCWVGRNREWRRWVAFWAEVQGGFPKNPDAMCGEAVIETLQAELLFEHYQTWRSKSYRKRMEVYRAVAENERDVGAEA